MLSLLFSPAARNGFQVPRTPDMRKTKPARQGLTPQKKSTEVDVEKPAAVGAQPDTRSTGTKIDNSKAAAVAQTSGAAAEGFQRGAEEKDSGGKKGGGG